MRDKIRGLERGAVLPETSRAASGWHLGDPGLDSRLGPEGLDPCALHEVKPLAASAAGGASALGFVLRLAVRRLQALKDCGQAGRASRILWCWPQAIAIEAGRLYGPGLVHLGLDPGAIVMVETARASDALWALEEGLRSKGVALAAGVLPEIALTPARRLALAAEQHGTPAIVLTGCRTAATVSTATRWRIATAPGGSHAFDPAAPGAKAFAVTLERCRRRPEAEAFSRFLEWSDETHRFRLASDVAHRADAPPRPREPGVWRRTA